MTAYRWGTAAVIAVLVVLVASTFGLIALAPHDGASRSAGQPSVSLQLTVMSGPTCTVTVSAENVQNNAIQSAINTYASTPGATICVGPGTYPEQLRIDNTTDLTLWGSGNGSTFLAPSSVAVNEHDLDSGLPTSALIGADNDAGLTVGNLSVVGSPTSAADVAGCDGYVGIYFADSSGTIVNDSVSGINQNDGCQSQNAVVVNNGYFLTNTAVAQSVAITNNTVTGYGKNGITCNDPGITCSVTGNTVSTTPMVAGYAATNGIQFYGANGAILNNTVSGNNYLPAWCGAGNYFFSGAGPCAGNALAEATGILLYAPGNGVNVSWNHLAGNQIAVADVGGPVSAWYNTVTSAGFYGVVLDFNATLGWLGSPLYSSGPYEGTVGDNTVQNTNVGVLVYDDNASLLGNQISDVNVSVEAATDLPVDYQIDLTGNVADSNVSGALLGDISSYQAGVNAFAFGQYTLDDNTFVNASVGSAGAPNGVLVYGQSATLSGNTVTGFDTGLTAILSPTGVASVTGNVLTAPAAPPAGDGAGAYLFADTASVSDNQISGWSWMNGPGWWPNSQTPGLFAQCLSTCDLTGNTLTNNAIGIAVISYLYGPSPAPAWPYAAAPSQGPITVSDNTVSDSGAFGIAVELNQGIDLITSQPAASQQPSVTVSGNTVDNTLTGAVGLMVDQGVYTIDDNVFLGTTLTGSSGASQPTGLGSIGTASIQVLNAYDYETYATLQGNEFLATTLPLAVLNDTSEAPGAFASAQFGELVNFTESGLPAGTTWYLNLSGAPNVALTAPAFEMDLQNGSYGYNAADDNPIYTASSPVSSVDVAGAGLLVSVPFVLETYAATFTESGLAPSTSWSVTIGATTLSSTSDQITFDLVNGSYSYSVANLAGYMITGSNTGSFLITGTGVSESVTFTVVTYTVAFQESGLAPGTSWGVTVDAQSATSTSTYDDFQLANGTYGYTLAAVPGYTTSSYTGSVTVNGGPQTVAVTFSVFTYTVTFKESGLATGTSWSVTTDSSTQSSTGTKITYALGNGSYGYTVGVVPGYARIGTGTVDVAGSAVTVQVTFVPSVYVVTFVEKGLPHATPWSVTLGSDTQTATVAKIKFTVANGSYAFTIGGVAGWHLVTAAYSGSVSVNGGPVKIIDKFAKTTYKLTFVESGLAPGTSWQVKVGAQTVASTTNKIFAWFANGTYNFRVLTVNGYTATPSSGSITVASGPKTTNIVFS